MIECTRCGTQIKCKDMVYVLRGHTFVCCSLECLLKSYGMDIIVMQSREYEKKCRNCDRFFK